MKGGVGLKKAEWAVSIGETIHYIVTVMKNNKSLIHTNKFLANRQIREHMLVVHAASSARIERVPNAMSIAKKASKIGNSRRLSKRP